MKKNKFIKISMLFLSLALLIFIFSSHFIVKAEETVGYGGKISLREFVKLSWNDVKNLGFSDGTSLKAGSGYYPDINRSSHVYSTRNSMCFHSTSIDSSGGSNIYLKAIIDIDSRGNVTLTTDKETINLGNDITGVKQLAVFCAKISEKSEEYELGVHDYYKDYYDTYYIGSDGKATASGEKNFNYKYDSFVVGGSGNASIELTYRHDFWKLMSLRIKKSYC